MSENNIEPQDMVQEAVVILENTLQGKGKGVDQNLLTAIDILSNYEPSVSLSGPAAREQTNLEREIAEVWNKFLAPEVKRHAQPTGIRRGTLYVSVDSQLWLSELVRYRRKEILAHLQTHFGSETVKTVSYRADETLNEVTFRFFLPAPLLQFSATPQAPCRFEPEHPRSAQDCVREALGLAGKRGALHVSFEEDPVQAPPPENPPTSAPPREALDISKRSQHSVFKRDAFTCKGCGRKAPEVLLHVRKAEAPAKESNRYIDHFVTLCAECIQAKGPPAEEEFSSLEKLALRREQLDLMIELEKLSNYWSEVVPGYFLNENGRHRLAELTSRFSPEEIMRAMQIAASKYLEFDNGQPTKQSVENAWDKVGGICCNTQLQERYPYRRRIYLIRASILKRRFPGFNEQEAFDLMKNAAELNVNLDELERFSQTAASYEAWRSALQEFIAKQSGQARSS